MKRFLIIAVGLLMLAVGQVNAQTLEQKKICALKWTLQQPFTTNAFQSIHILFRQLLIQVPIKFNLFQILAIHHKAHIRKPLERID